MEGWEGRAEATIKVVYQDLSCDFTSYILKFTSVLCASLLFQNHDIYMVVYLSQPIH